MTPVPTQEEIDARHEKLKAMLHEFFPMAMERNVMLSTPTSLDQYMTEAVINHGISGWSGVITTKSGAKHYCSSVKRAGEDYIIKLDEHHKSYDKSVHRVVIAKDAVESFTLVYSIKSKDYVLEEGHALKMYEGLADQ